MSTVILKEEFHLQLGELNTAITALNTRKIKLILKTLGIMPEAKDLELMLDWELIVVTVLDKQMAVQLNKISSYIPNLKFVVDDGHLLFTMLQSEKGRRVWKER
ncbi:MAG TPA: hypothetical protein VGB50_09955 [Flavobacterium sp.]|jgi:hypothetical protein